MEPSWERLVPDVVNSAVLLLSHSEKLVRRLWSAVPAARYKALTLVLEKPCSAS